MPVKQNVNNDINKDCLIADHTGWFIQTEDSPKHTYNVLFAAVHLVKQFKFNSNA